jgi:PIN domain nuclease of toxin-antitoxin system
MKLLLDTHCLIWALTDAPALGVPARAAIARAGKVAFSEASVWEIGLIWRKGKINLQPRRVVEQRIARRLSNVCAVA